MLTHDYFEEICAAASIGQATGEELAQLEQHAADCTRCRQTYFDCLNVAAQQFAIAKQNPTLTTKELEECIDSDLFVRRFLERAEREGITFSCEVGEAVNRTSPIPFGLSPPAWWRMPHAAITAALLFAAITSTGYFYWTQSFNRGSIRSDSQLTLSGAAGPSATIDPRIAKLEDANLRLQAEIARLTGDLRKTSELLVVSKENVRSASKEQAQLALDRESLELQVKQIQQELASAHSLAASAQQEARLQQQRAADAEGTVLTTQLKLRDIEDTLKEKSTALDQERQLLNLGHDVTDLMGARNLHIVDVVDTDGHGKPRPAFGRIFFTEGKSLIFYAYDLNETKIQKANYQYQVWAKKEGVSQQAQRLGIFYSDDKAQRRWVFKCEDPKLLQEIDSVFVTFGRPDSNPSHPEGPSLMYAYLRGQPNHP
jgi:hypothetical protein